MHTLSLRPLLAARPNANKQTTHTRARTRTQTRAHAHARVPQVRGGMGAVAAAFLWFLCAEHGLAAARTLCSKLLTLPAAGGDFFRAAIEMEQAELKNAERQGASRKLASKEGEAVRVGLGWGRGEKGGGGTWAGPASCAGQAYAVLLVRRAAALSASFFPPALFRQGLSEPSLWRSMILGPCTF